MIKAGGAGSIPDGTTIGTWKSQPLSVLLSDIGEAVSALNTLVVGLDAVEKGHKKPDSLDISWNPDDFVAAARKSRKFLIEAVLVRVFEVLLEHLNCLSSLSRFSIMTEKWKDRNASRAERIWEFYNSILGSHYLVASAVLTCHWRNKIIHPRSKKKLELKQKALLRDNEAEISRDFKNISVDCLLCHFEENRITLKDASVLVAMVIRLARRVNELIEKNLERQDFDDMVKYLGLLDEIEKVRRETRPEKQLDSVRRVFKSRAPLLLSGFEEFYPDFGHDEINTTVARTNFE